MGFTRITHGIFLHKYHPTLCVQWFFFWVYTFYSWHFFSHKFHHTILRCIDQALENERNEYTKPNQHVLKYKHNHIGGNDSSSTFDFKIINVKEKCKLSAEWTNKTKYNNSSNNNNEKEKEDNNLPKCTPNSHSLISTPCIGNIPVKAGFGLGSKRWMD